MLVGLRRRRVDEFTDAPLDSGDLLDRPAVPVGHAGGQLGQVLGGPTTAQLAGGHVGSTISRSRRGEAASSVAARPRGTRSRRSQQ